jgi:hypothetical protein
MTFLLFFVRTEYFKNFWNPLRILTSIFGLFIIAGIWISGIGAFSAGIAIAVLKLTDSEFISMSSGLMAYGGGMSYFVIFAKRLIYDNFIGKGDK